MNSKTKVFLALAMVIALAGLTMGGAIVTNREAFAATPAPAADEDNSSVCDDMVNGMEGMMDGTEDMMGGDGHHSDHHAAPDGSSAGPGSRGGTGMMGSYQGSSGMMGGARSSGGMMGGYGL